MNNIVKGAGILAAAVGAIALRRGAGVPFRRPAAAARRRSRGFG